MQNNELKNEDSQRTNSRAVFELSGKERAQNIRTYSSDIANTIKTGEASMVNIAISEHRRKEKDKEQISVSNPKNKLFLVGGISLFIFGLILMGYFIYQALPKTVPITQNEVSIPTLVKIDSQKGIQITLFTRERIKESIAKSYEEAKPAIGKITGMFLYTVEDTTSPKNILGTEDFLTSIESLTPGTLQRSLSDTFTMGVYGSNTDGLFIVFETNSYTNAFAGMLEWEPSLFDEMYKMFKINIEGDNKKLFTEKFKDAVIKNQDTRAIYDANNNPVLMYAFLGEDKSKLIITNEAETLDEVASRLTASNLKR
jgi:hypothetical protein